MNRYIKTVFAVALQALIPLLALTFTAPSNVNAQAGGTASTRIQIPNPSKYNSLEDLVSAGTTIIRPVFIIAFGGMILYAAFLIITARGDDTQIANAKKTLGGAIVGFTIAVLAPTVANIALGLIGIEGFGAPTA